MIMLKKHWVALLIFLPLLVAKMNARLIEVDTRTRLFSHINRASLAVVYLYEFNKKCRDRCQKERVRYEKERIRSVSENRRYHYANVVFIALNVLYEPDIAHEFGIYSLPAVVLFRNGNLVNNGQLSGECLNELNVVSFIDENVGEDINEIVQEKKEHEERLEEAYLSSWYYLQPYYCGPCYRWGCGFGAGYCCSPWCW